ncbi:hypothetical protein SHO565_21780 [Streptomyces sp. HO565]
MLRADCGWPRSPGRRAGRPEGIAKAGNASYVAGADGGGHLLGRETSRPRIAPIRGPTAARVTVRPKTRPSAERADGLPTPRTGPGRHAPLGKPPAPRGHPATMAV